MYKVRPLIDHLAAVFPKYYRPGRNVSIDEMMIGTRCRISFLEYIPKKPTRFGIKVWVLAEAKTGYVLDFDIYTGAEADPVKKGLGYRVVMKLMEQYQGKGHCVFIDNFYTSPQLLLDLLAHSTYCVGTVKTNRKDFPVQLIPEETMDPGSFRFATAGQLTAVWWRDRRDVYALSTMHNKSVVNVLKRPKGSREKRPLPCPSIIDDYNQYMGGVDLIDQHLSYYTMTKRRSLKWWKKVFWRLIDITIVNAWIIFHKNHPNSSINTQKKSRLDLAENLVQPLLDLMASPTCPAYLRTTKGRKPVSTAKRLIGKPFAYKSKKRGRCLVCGDHKTSAGKRKDTKTQNFCPKCDVFLCLGKCFEDYHSRTSY